MKEIFFSLSHQCTTVTLSIEDFVSLILADSQINFKGRQSNSFFSFGKMFLPNRQQPTDKKSSLPPVAEDKQKCRYASHLMLQ
jgi:hypothetical protein